MSSARFLALGDSYTIGEQVDAGARWPVQLAAMLRAGGTRVKMALSSTRQTLEIGRAHV